MLCNPTAGSRVPGCRSSFWVLQETTHYSQSQRLKPSSQSSWELHGCSFGTDLLSTCSVSRGSWPIVHQYLITLPWPKSQSHHNPSLSPFLERSWSIALGFWRPKATVVGTIAASRQHWHLGPWWIFIDFPMVFQPRSLLVASGKLT